MADQPLTPVALRPHRDAAIARLCEHFARDHIDAEGLEKLIDRAHHAATAADLDAIFSGLPALGRHAPEETSPEPLRASRAPGPRREQQAIVAVMGGAERRGAWVPARRVYVTAFMGGAVLDFRDAALEGVTEVYVVAIMGGVEIVVPPGVTVDSDGIGIMGGFDHGGRGRFPVDAVGPVLRISGLALMGGVEIRDQPRHERDPRRHSLVPPPGSAERQRLERGERSDGASWGGWGR